MSAERMTFALDEHARVVDALRTQIPLLLRIAETIVDTIRAGGRIYLLGNGGSAADAQHIAAELVGRFKQDRLALPAIALTTDTSILTAVCNDLGGDQIFARQVEALVRKGDVVWALSVSGTSPNVIVAVDRAISAGASIIGFTGETGGTLAERCDLCLRAAHPASDRVQEAHELAYHMICEHVEQSFAKPAPRAD